MNLPSQKISGAWKFGLVWLVLNAAGWGVGFGLELLILHNANLGSLNSLFSSLVAAGIIGLAQWLALRWLLEPMRTGSQGIAWVILTMFGYTAGFLAAGLVTGLLGENFSQGDAVTISLGAWGLVGLFTGWLQWMELQFFTRGAVWWVGANVLGYALGGTVMLVIRVDQGTGPEVYALSGLVVGTATLVAISRLRRRVLFK